MTGVDLPRIEGIDETTALMVISEIGLDMSKVRHQDDIEQEVSRWVDTLADERFDLLEKIASEMAKAKGVKLPPKLTAVPS